VVLPRPSIGFSNRQARGQKEVKALGMSIQVDALAKPDELEAAIAAAKAGNIDGVMA
jgi:hypothetical protein